MKHKVWLKLTSEMSVLYGNHVLKGGLGRITDSIVPGDGVVVFYVGRSVRVWDCGEEYAGLSEVGSEWDRCASSG